MEYTIENEVLKLTVTTWGAQVKSVVRKCDGVEHMWQADPSVWGYHAPILFPHTARVVDDIIEAKGKRYPSKQHGFARLVEHSYVSQTDDTITLELCSSPETLERFPYEFRLVSTFHIEGAKLHHTLTVENKDVDVLPFGIGYHPAFAIPFDDRHSFSDYEFRFSQMESPLCIDSVTTDPNYGEKYCLGTNITTIPLTEHLFDHDSFCMLNLRSDTLGIYEKDTGRAVVCDIRKFPYTLIWSKPSQPHFVCIEPWESMPNTENRTSNWMDNPAAAILNPGECWATTLTTEFRR